MLVNVWGWKKLLLFNVSCELILIFGFAAILTGLAAVDGTAGQNGFVEKLRLALCTVRLSTDSVFGWEEKKPSTGLEIILLTMEGWLHWLLLNVFSAIIVARALRPRRALVFAPGASGRPSTHSTATLRSCSCSRLSLRLTPVSHAIMIDEYHASFALLCPALRLASLCPLQIVW